MVSSYVRSGPDAPYFSRWFLVRPQDLSNFFHKSRRWKVEGDWYGRKFLSIASANVKLEKFFPRAASVTFLMSSTSCGTFRNFGTGAHSFVSLLINTPVPTPQLGWQPQLTVPHCASGPWLRSANAENVLISEIGNQSRVGSIFPIWLLTSWARCDSV